MAQVNVQGFAKVVPGALITVCPFGSTGIPCTPANVPIFSNSLLTITQTNPFHADGNGNYGWFSVPGQFTYTITGTGVVGRSFTVTMPCAPNVGCIGTFAPIPPGTVLGNVTNIFAVPVPVTLVCSIITNAICGNGTPDTLPKFVAPGVIGNSLWTDTGSISAYGGTKVQAQEFDAIGASQGVVEFFNAAGTFAVTLSVNNPPADYTIRMPDAIASAPGDTLLVDTVVAPNVQLKWGASSALFCTATNGAIQYNNAGVAGCSVFIYSEPAPNAALITGTASTIVSIVLTDGGAPPSGAVMSAGAGVTAIGVIDSAGNQVVLFPTSLTDTNRNADSCAQWDGSTPRQLLDAGSGIKCPTVLITSSDKFRTCMIVIGTDNGAVLADADIAPQIKQCQIPYAATVVEIDVASDAGTPELSVAHRLCTVAPCSGGNETVTNLLSAPLGSLPGTSCARTAAVLGVDGQTTCSATLQNNTNLAAGTWLETLSATAGGVAARFSIAIHFTVD